MLIFFAASCSAYWSLRVFALSYIPGASQPCPDLVLLLHHEHCLGPLRIDIPMIPREELCRIPPFPSPPPFVVSTFDDDGPPPPVFPPALLLSVSMHPLTPHKLSLNLLACERLRPCRSCVRHRDIAEVCRRPSLAFGRGQ